MVESIVALEKIGLTKSEAKVYIALLELGSSTTGPIVDKSGIASSKIYEILEKLARKGLVSYILKGKIKYFEAQTPGRILDYLESKEKDIAKQRQEIEKIMPALFVKKEMSHHKQDAAIYRGMKGLKTAFYEAMGEMKKGETAYVYGVPPRSEKANNFFINLNKELAKRGLYLKILFNESARNDKQTKKEYNPTSEIRFMPEGIETPASVNIYNDRVIIFPKETEKHPLLIAINNKEVAQSFKAQFDIFWNQKTHVYTGLEGPRLVLRDIAKTGKECLAMGIEEDNFKKIVPEALNDFIADMNKRRIKERLIFKKGSKPVRHQDMQARFLPEPYFSPLTVEIYGNKVALIDWTHPITTIFIDKKEIAAGYRKYFELLWKIAKKD